MTVQPFSFATSTVVSFFGPKIRNHRIEPRALRIVVVGENAPDGEMDILR